MWTQHDLVLHVVLQALANSVWALGKMGVAVPPKLLRRLLWASYNSMYNFTPQVCYSGSCIDRQSKATGVRAIDFLAAGLFEATGVLQWELH